MNKNMDLAKRIIVALDVGSREEALPLIKQLKGVEVFKVGLKLFTAEGPPLLREIKILRKKIFLDLKLHDIPNTVAEAVKVAVKHGANMLTLHASGGREMMEKAVNAAEKEAEKEGTDKPLLLAVTILTSLQDDQLREIGMPAATLTQVLRLAKLAREAGVDGVVCSPQEIEIIKKEIGQDLLVVVPGIRPSWAAAHDQKRIMTPSLALRKGADYLVIGRPIIAAPSPQEAFLKILDELRES
jgi:orotidine-5'-phosphate decarboxylase